MEKYDPMVEFFKAGIPYLFKQGIAVVISVVFCVALWFEMSRRDSANERKIDRINSEWSASLNEARRDWLMCEQKRQELEVRFAELKTRVDLLLTKRRN